MRTGVIGLALAGALSLSSLASAAIVFVDLGTAAPPSTVGPYTVTAFDTTPQAAIVDGTSVTVIPGSPISGSLTLATALDKHTVPSGGWSTWSHGYTGPVFGTYTALTTNTMTLPTGPAGAGAFRFYIEPDTFAVFSVSATTNLGGSSGPISVNGNGGANGIGFYTTTPGETITTVTVNVPSGANGFAIGEFAIAAFSSVPTIPMPSLLMLALLLAGITAWSLRRGARATV